MWIKCVDRDHHEQDICDSLAQVFEFYPGNNYEMINCHNWDSSLHRKMVYREKVRKCRHFIFGKCCFDKDDCWFIHETPVTIPYQNSLNEL